MNGESCLYINSIDRQTYQTASNFSMRASAGSSDRNISEIKMTQARVNYNMFNVVSGFNTFFYDDGATNWQITLTPGYYTLTSAATQIQTLVRAATGDLTFTCVATFYGTTPNGYLTFASGATNVGIGLTTDQLKFVLGLKIVAATAASVFLDYANIIFTPFIDFCSIRLNQFNRSDFPSNVKTNSLIERFHLLPNAAAPQLPFSQLVIYEQSKKILFNPDSSIGNMDISVYDQYGNLLNVQNGDGFEFQLNILLS